MHIIKPLTTVIKKHFANVSTNNKLYIEPTNKVLLIKYIYNQNTLLTTSPDDIFGRRQFLFGAICDSSNEVRNSNQTRPSQKVSLKDQHRMVSHT